MIVYHIFHHTKYDNNKGMPMKVRDVDIVYSYCPTHLDYHFKRYGLKGLFSICLTERGAKRRIRRLNKR